MAFNSSHLLDSCFSNLLLFWQNFVFKQNVRKQSNKHTTSLADAGVAGCSPGVPRATLLRPLGLYGAERPPLHLSALEVSSVHFPNQCSRPVSSPISTTESLPSLFTEIHLSHFSELSHSFFISRNLVLKYKCSHATAAATPLFDLWKPYLSNISTLLRQVSTLRA